jgi:hypothetical protein
MTAVFEPWTGRTDVIRGAFAFDLNQIDFYLSVRGLIDQVKPTLIKTGISTRSLPSHLLNGSSSCKRLDFGLTSTLMSVPLAGGAW